MKGLICLFLAFVPLSAQMLQPTWIPEQLVTYLQLTREQAVKIVDNNAAYAALVQTKNQRMYEVQDEIAVETAKEIIDPTALGVRYREIELICRDINQAGVDVRKQNNDALNDTQKAKLSALEEAMKLAPLFTQAQNVDLLPPSTTISYSAVIGVYAPIIYGIPSSSASGCRKPNTAVLFDPIGLTGQPRAGSASKP